MTKKNVLVLMGGASTEREVSLRTGRMIAGSIDSEKYSVIPVEVTSDGHWQIMDASASGELASGHAAEAAAVKATDLSTAVSRWSSVKDVVNLSAADVVFIALHGAQGEDGTLQGMLELLGLPYTGSGVLASALAMDKLRARQLFMTNGISVPRHLARSRRQLVNEEEIEKFIDEIVEKLGLPCVVKPNDHGSSVGISIIRERADLQEAIKTSLSLSTIVLIEEYLKGTEITVGVYDDPRMPNPIALPVVEIVPRSTWFDYESKYQKGGADEICPARISDELRERVQEIAVKAHLALGCHGLSRTDIIIRDNDLFTLETNTLPGMTETSLYPQAARAVGIEFVDLLDRLIQIALLKD
ncbi:MAG: D-alanine--D-alanine ligase family protein [Acidobacteriota bacterium]